MGWVNLLGLASRIGTILVDVYEANKKSAARMVRQARADSVVDAPARMFRAKFCRKERRNPADEADAGERDDE